VCVQGAPGTGKTAVGLHRAAYLLYTYPDRLRRSGVLVVGPNDAFLHYIGQVLPSLGEGGLEVLAADPVAGGGGVEALGAGPHPGECGARLVEVVLLGLQVVGAEMEVGVGVRMGVGGGGRRCG
jgi:hypothetical protein